MLQVEEILPNGELRQVSINPQFIGAVERATVDHSYVCLVCGVGGERVARHDFNWCEKNKQPYHERQPGIKTDAVFIDVNGQHYYIKDTYEEFLQRIQ